MSKKHKSKKADRRRKDTKADIRRRREKIASYKRRNANEIRAEKAARTSQALTHFIMQQELDLSTMKVPDDFDMSPKPYKLESGETVNLTPMQLQKLAALPTAPVITAPEPEPSPAIEIATNIAQTGGFKLNLG